MTGSTNDVSEAPMRLERVSLADNARTVRDGLDASTAGAVEIDRPALDALPYRELVGALLRAGGFRFDFRGQSPASAVDMLADRVLGPGRLVHERGLFVADIAAVAAQLSGLVGGAPAQIQLRSFFAPGDVVWHLDRMAERVAFRLLWPIGRPEGMRVTARGNIDRARFAAFMRREYALLGALDARVLATGGDAEALWAHRPAQLEAMRTGRYPFVLDPARVWQVRPSAASIHRVDTPTSPGTFHRSSWANRRAPGLQLVVTAAG